MGPCVETRGTEPFEVVARAVASRYRPRSAHYYVRSKLRMDEVARALWRLGAQEPFGVVADVGCGRGQLGLLLLAAGFADEVRGVDWDAAKVCIAEDAAGDLAARFEEGDVREASLGEGDTVLIVDVLHYLTPAEQDALLVRAARAARGRVIVRDLDPERGASSALTRMFEWIGVKIGYNAGGALHPRPFDELAAVLEREGFTATRDDCSASALSNVLLVARRRA
jgi:2-polyprenyl-3-methyl-5-hydroxy-6-metoxy-1,4-benzoquinol methylase